MAEQTKTDFGITVTLADGTPFNVYTPHPKQREFHESPISNLIAWGNRSSGKACDINTPILTPFGYKTLNTLSIGDEVFGEDGLPCKVIWKSNIHYDDWGTFKITFDDGSEIICGGHHEWWVFDKNARVRLQRRSMEWRANRQLTRKDKNSNRKRRKLKDIQVESGAIVTTAEMFENQIFQTGDYTESNYAIRLAQPCQTSDKDLPLHPYILGVWLGDGNSWNGSYTGLDVEIADRISKFGWEVRKLKSQYTWSIPTLLSTLRSIRLYKNKHIPEEYFLGSKEQRLELLRGLMDTDGHCDKTGHATFYNKNENIARGVYRLAVTLGLKPSLSTKRAKLNGKDYGICYQVTWCSNLPVFTIPRKLNRLKKTISQKVTFRFVTKIELIADRPLQCIQVDNKSHLYLIGETCIPTHNSIMLRMDAHMRAFSAPNSNLILIRKTYKQLETSHVYFQGLPWSSLKQEMELLGGTFHSTKYICYYPNGSRLFLSYVGHETDALNLLSAEFLAAYFDELSTIPWEFFLKLQASVRVPRGSNLKAVVRAASNPLGESTPEIMKYFIEKDVDPKEDEDYLPSEWGDIKMGMEDNPHIDVDQYKRRLAGAGLPEHVKNAWLYGTYTDEEALFTFFPFKDNEPWHVIHDIDVEELVKKATIYRCYDHGYSPDPAYCAWVAHLGNRYIVFHEMVEKKMVIADIAAKMKAIDKELGISRVVTTFADPTIDVHTGQDIRTMKDIFEENGIPIELSINNREQFASAVHTALAEEVQLSENTIVPRLQIYGPGCPYLVKSLPMMRYDPDKPMRMANHKHDHPVVALAYFLISHSAGNFVSYEDRQKPRWMRPKNASRFVLGSDGVRDRRY